jgi:membrane fusion protein, multidrug efflux system
MKVTHFVRIVTSAAAVALLAACARPQPAPEPVRSVKLITVAPDALEANTEYAGEVRAQVESRLGFRVGGKLLERPAELGQRVKPGQLLARLDAQDLALSSQAAQAAVAAARTQRDLARADLERFKNLLAQGFVSGAEIDRRQATLDAAEASLKQAQAQSSVQGNQAGYARLVADAPGVVTAVQAEVGQVVSAGTPVVVLAKDGARDVVFAVPEDRLALVRPGTPATVRPWAGAPGATPIECKVREVAARRHRLRDAADAGQRHGRHHGAHERDPAVHRRRPQGQHGVGVRRRQQHGAHAGGPGGRCRRQPRRHRCRP